MADIQSHLICKYEYIFSVAWDGSVSPTYIILASIIIDNNVCTMPQVMLIVIIAIWIYCFVLSTTPYYGLGGYSFYRQGGVCIARLPPESWWLVLYIVYSTVPILLLMAMIMATFTFAARFARRQQKSASGSGSKSRVGVNNKANISRTISTLEEGSSNLKQVNYAATAECEGKHQSRSNCCCFREFLPACIHQWYIPLHSATYC